MVPWQGLGTAVGELLLYSPQGCLDTLRVLIPSITRRHHWYLCGNISRSRLAFIFAGVNCEINFDDCASNPCVHGMCMDGVNRYSCVCSPGFTGKAPFHWDDSPVAPSLWAKGIERKTTFPMFPTSLSLGRLNVCSCVSLAWFSAYRPSLYHSMKLFIW